MFSDYVEENEKVFQTNNVQDETVEAAIQETVSRLERGGTIYTMGNGGSACDAADFASELTNRFRGNYDRERLPAICLASDVVQMTAVVNDHGGEYIFVDRLEALRPHEDDVLIGFSTSGSSQNIVRAFQYAAQKHMYRVGFSGKLKSPMEDWCDVCFVFPHPLTDIVQNCHRILYHYMAGKIDEYFRGEKK